MRRLRRIALRLLALPTAAIAAGAAAADAGRAPAPIAAGVSIAGIPVGGFTSEEARALVRAQMGGPLVLAIDGKRWKLDPARIGASSAVDDAVAAALAAGTGTAVRVRATVDGPELRRYVRLLDGLLARPARNARFVGLANLRPAFVRATWGRRLDRAATAAAIERALRVGGPVAPVFRIRRPKVTASTFGPVIVIRRESKGLYVYDGRRFVRRMGVATGQARYPTPLGTFRIATMRRHPWWYPPDSDWARGLKPVPPGPGNPLGTRWMGLSAWGVGIHGTPDAASIGYSASHGCIRLAIPDAEWLFARVRPGTPVVIVSA